MRYTHNEVLIMSTNYRLRDKLRQCASFYFGAAAPATEMRIPATRIIRRETAEMSVREQSQSQHSSQSHQRHCKIGDDFFCASAKTGQQERVSKL